MLLNEANAKVATESAGAKKSIAEFKKCRHGMAIITVRSERYFNIAGAAINCRKKAEELTIIQKPPR